MDLAVVSPLARLSDFAIAGTAYDVSIDGSDYVPERSVEIEGKNLTIEVIAQVSPGTDITVSVEARTADSQYDIEPQNHERKLMMSRHTRTGY